MSDKQDRYFMIHKPYNMVSQFISPHNVKLLTDLNFNFPPGTHALGRLDNNSEGLLLLTTNKKITRLLYSENKKHNRVYLVQLNNIVSEKNIERLRNGVSITVSGAETYVTPQCIVLLASPSETEKFKQTAFSPPGLSTWLFITLTEGKFHQVRKMIKAINHRCLRLIRVSIENIKLGPLAPGEIIELEENEFFEKLSIKQELIR